MQVTKTLFSYHARDKQDLMSYYKHKMQKTELIRLNSWKSEVPIVEITVYPIYNERDVFGCQKR